MMMFDFQAIKQKFFRRKEAEPDRMDAESIGYGAGDISYDDTDPADRAKTVKKKLIMTGVGAVALFAVASVVGNALFRDDGNVPQQQQQTASAATGGIAGTPADAFPSRYSDIAQQQQKQSGHKHGTDMRDPYSAEMSQPAQVNIEPAPVRREQEPVRSGVIVPVVQPDSMDSGTAHRAQEADKAAEEKAKEEALIDGSALSFRLAAAMADEGASLAVQPIGNAPVSGNDTMRNVSDAPPAGNAGGGYILNAGSVIQATLLTGVTSSVPNGDVVAQVRQNIYDSLTGQYLLIPQGSRLIGKTALAGGKRIGVIFQRIILPSGAAQTRPDPGL